MQSIGAVGSVVGVIGIASIGYFLQWSSRKERALLQSQGSVQGFINGVDPVHAVHAQMAVHENLLDGDRSGQTATLSLPRSAVKLPEVRMDFNEVKDACTTTKEVLHRLISKLILPIIIATALWKVQFSREYLEIPLYLGGLSLVMWGITNTLIKNKGNSACAVFGNVTYVGLPILSSLYGLTDQVIVTVGLCEITTTLLNILTKNGRDWQFLKNPCLWAITIGIVLRIFPYPALIDPIIKNLAIWMSLTMIMVLGMTIKLTMNWSRSLWLICGAKLILMPALLMTICQNPLLVLEAAMPCQLLTTVLYKNEEISNYCFASILLSLVTIPIWSGIVNGL
jgi:predicted permease